MTSSDVQSLRLARRPADRPLRSPVAEQTQSDVVPRPDISTPQRPLMPDFARLLLRFQGAIDDRRRTEEEQQRLALGPDQTGQLLRAHLEHLLAERTTRSQTAQQEFDETFSRHQREFDKQMAETEDIHAAILRKIEADAEAARREVERLKGDSEWVVSSVLDDSAEDSPVRDFERMKALLTKSQDEQSAELIAVSESLDAAASDLGRTRPDGFEFPLPGDNRDELQQSFLEAVQDSRRSLKLLAGLWTPQLLRGWRWLGLVLVLTAAVGIPVGLFVDPRLAGLTDRQDPGWLGIAALAGLAAAVFVSLILYTLATLKQADLLRRAAESLAEAGWLHQHWLKLARENLQAKRQSTEEQQRRIERDRSGALRRYEQAHQRKVEEIDIGRTQALKEEHSRFAGEHGSLQNERRQQLAELEARHQQLMSQLGGSSAQAVEQAEIALRDHLAVTQRARTEHWARLKGTWEQAVRDLTTATDAAHNEVQRQQPRWDSLLEQGWQPAARIPEVIRLGEHRMTLADWDGAVSADMRLAPRNSEFTLPLALDFPRGASVMFTSPHAEARATALRGMQSLMLRLLTSIPPGKLRFTIIDPVGLGESFAGFMHLADVDELLVTSRIWTEAGQIESRLADLTEHMENVLQKYLRNEFPTIEEYNASAGEVAEPYHFLVIGDFPAKFSEIAARRLISIVNSGPRCGVYTLLNLDPTKQLPNSFSLADVEGAMTQLRWRDGAFHTANAPLARWPVSLESPPEPAEFTSLVKQVGDASRDARRVEVSFDRVTPAASEIWSRDSRKELVVPLGRAGATRLQQLQLGRGTSQHMLVAGKTGSGKSTFLHILITNLALFYSPDEVNFFLIDFKKGVEFKDYATLRLPHARVIAVESDREFGVSTLQKLDEILQERGELFRRQGVQDIAGYRDATQRPLPRILLVVDEFQEFFIEDDKLSQTAALLLDRLVRQGRAFGMHVILGSQTLGGAYSLARTTLGQVAVRVALQCSEADAHLILSEENTAARLLVRPGEAIYNDANGLVEGNHPFQIAWISDQQREQSLGVMQQRLLRSGIHVEPAVVFEGNIPSDLTRNGGLEQLTADFPARTQPILRPTFWLGDAVEIGPPTAVTLQRQSGQNLLLVGQDPESAQGVVTAALLALAASRDWKQDTAASSLVLLDGSYPDEAEAERWRMVTEFLPGPIRSGGPADASKVVEDWTAELTRREAASGGGGFPPWTLTVFHVARFRDLRKPDDEFSLGGFGGEPKPPQPGQLFADLLARGPAVGMHVLVWCDSLSNVDRWFSRGSQKELELRIAFQMNASDSSNFIDTPAAARLGTHRALLYREETGTAVKFRPYGIPTPAWLAQWRQRLEQGAEPETATDLEGFRIL